MKMGDLTPLHAVVFRVGGLVCALPSGTVREILPSGRATRIPGASAAVAGLVNVRGRMVTAVDAHAVLGQPVPDDPALLLLERPGAPAGLQVGEVLDFLEVPGAASREREAPAGVDPRLVQGTGSWNGQRMLLLDIDALLSPFLGG
jgi:purine-binding chemotaxis protein CheW